MIYFIYTYIRKITSLLSESNYNRNKTNIDMTMIYGVWALGFVKASWWPFWLVGFS